MKPLPVWVLQKRSPKGVDTDAKSMIFKILAQQISVGLWRSWERA
jgi:hypothetical protein